MIIARTRKSQPSTSCCIFVRTTIALNLIFATILNTLFIVAATTIHLVRHWRLVCARRRGPCALRPLARAHGPRRQTRTRHVRKALRAYPSTFIHHTRDPGSTTLAYSLPDPNADGAPTRAKTLCFMCV